MTYVNNIQQELFDLENKLNPVENSNEIEQVIALRKEIVSIFFDVFTVLENLNKVHNFKPFQLEEGEVDDGWRSANTQAYDLLERLK